MAQVDPHGWTLTLISVSVVFIALIILYFLYSLSGSIAASLCRRLGRNRLLGLTAFCRFPDAADLNRNLMLGF